LNQFIFSKILDVGNSFPGCIVKKYILVVNTFNKEITITNYTISDTRFNLHLKKKKIEPNQKVKIGYVLFDASNTQNNELNFMKPSISIERYWFNNNEKNFKNEQQQKNNNKKKIPVVPLSIEEVNKYKEKK